MAHKLKVPYPPKMFYIIDIEARIKLQGVIQCIESDLFDNDLQLPIVFATYRLHLHVISHSVQLLKQYMPLTLDMKMSSLMP